MELYILSKQDLSILSICKLADYQINLDEETNAKSTFTLMKTNGLKKENYMVLNGLYRQFIFVIDDVQTEKESDVVTVTALDISNIFDRKVIEKNIDIMKSKSIEEFLANTISEDFVNSDDTALNVRYIEIYWHTNTQGNVATNAENGLYNFHTFLTNCRQYKNIYTDFKLENLGNPQTVEGKRISVEAKNRKIVDISLHGESQQATRSGKNFLENTGVSNTSNGVTFTINDDKTILVDGNNDGTANSSFIINNYSLKAGTYILNGCPSGGSSTTYRLGIQKTSDWSILGLDTGSGSEQFTIDEATNIQVAIFIQKGQTISNLLFKPMIRLSSIIDDTYEQYGVMPSPDYISKIENLEGKNLVQQMNWKQVPSITTGATVTTVHGYGTDFIEVDNTKNYIFSYSGTASSKYVAYYDESKNFLGHGTNLQIDSYANWNVTKYVRLRIDCSENAVTNLQLEAGTVATPYVPYNSLEFKVEGKNLYNVSDTNAMTEGITVDNEGWITVTGDNTDGTATKFFNYYTNNLNLKTGTNYNVIAEVKNVSGTGNASFVSVTSLSQQFKTNFYRNFSVLANNTIYNSINETSDEFLGNRGLRTFISFSSGQSGSITFRLSVLEDTTITAENFEYEEYKSQVATFPLGEEKLMKGSYLADDGIHHRRGQYKFTGNETGWNYNSAQNAFWIRNSQITNCKNQAHAKLCNYFPYSSSSFYVAEINTLCENSNSTMPMFIFKVSTDVANSLETWKTWLQNHNLIVEYELAEEEIVPYTEEQQEAWNNIKNLTLFEGVNHISSDANMVLKYYPLESVGLKFVLRIDIENKQETTKLIDTTLPEVTDYNKVYEEDVTAKVTAYIRENNTEYNLYLKTDRTTTTNKNDPDRASGKIEVISVDTVENAPEEALNVMKGNNYKHLVEFKIAKTSKLMDITELHIGRPIRIKTDDDIYDSYISAITLSDENFVYFKSGSLRITLLDKLKKTSNTVGDKLDRTGGKITGNLDVSGTLKENGKTLLDLTYPVGSIYMSINSSNPSILFGRNMGSLGKW